MSKEKEIDKWVREHSAEVIPSLEASALYTGIVTDNFIESPMCALQLGLAILMDKPIVLVAEKSQKIPGNLAKIARVIERVDFEKEDDMKRVRQSIIDLSNNL